MLDRSWLILGARRLGPHTLSPSVPGDALSMLKSVTESNIPSCRTKSTTYNYYYGEGGEGVKPTTRCYEGE